jgi:hypothetical protein
MNNPRQWRAAAIMSALAMKRPLRVACIIATSMVIPTAFGHHASNLDYDQDTVGAIEGVVQDIFWSNPHIHVYLTVAKEDGSTEAHASRSRQLQSAAPAPHGFCACARLRVHLLLL